MADPWHQIRHVPRRRRASGPVVLVGIASLAFATSASAVLPGALRNGATVPPGHIVAPPGAVDPAARVTVTPRGLILKLREGVGTCLSCSITRGERVGTLAPGSHFDELSQRYGVRRARPLLPTRPDDQAPRSRAAAAERSARVATRYPERARRAPAHAAMPDFSRTYVLDMRRHPDMESVARAFAADPAVEYCEPDYTVRTAFVPNDPFYSSCCSWGQQFADLWGIPAIDAQDAWDVTRGNSIVVAVVDTGIDYTHPDLAANVWTNPGEVPDNGVDDDLNGYVDDVHGWNFADGNADPIDDYFHGTHVAGTIAAVGDNTTGVIGVAFESRVMAVRALGTSGYGTISDAVRAIQYAVDNGADVINASWGLSSFSQTLADAVAGAHAAGVVFVAAAGNSSEDVGGFFPASLPHAIAVSAVTEQGARADFSNFGVQLDVAAPGGGDGPPPDAAVFPAFSILSVKSSAISPAIHLDPVLTLVQGGAEYLRLAGTSMATPHVAGVAALVLAANPTFGVEQVRQVLRSTADDLGPAGFDTDTGAGRVNAARAVVAPPPLVAHIVEPRGGRLVGAAAIDLLGSAEGPGFTAYTLDYRTVSDPEGWVRMAGPIGAPVSNGLLATWDASSVDDGDYVVRLLVERPGESFTDFVPINLRNVAIDSPERLSALRGDRPIAIRGTAAGGGFVDYQLEYRRPALDPDAWRTDGVTLAVPPGTPVRSGLLATLDVAGMTEGDRFDFRLTVRNRAGTQVTERKGIVVDPTIRAGWPQSLVGVVDAEYLTVADLDVDGVQEILVGSGDEVIVFEPDGSVRPGWPQSVATADYPLVDTRGSPIVADITGDALPEVVATNRYQVLAWTGDGVLLPGFPITVDHFVSGGNDWLTAGDRDGDGKDDIICTGVLGIRTYRGDGSEIPGSELRSVFGVAATAAGQAVGDARVEIGRFDRRRSPRTGQLSQKGDLLLIAPDGGTIASLFVNPTFFPHVSMADLDADGNLETLVVYEKSYRKTKALALSAAGLRVSTRRGRFRNGIKPLMGNAQLSFADLDRNGFAEVYSYERRLPWNYDSYQESEFGAFVIGQHRDAGPPPAPLVHKLFFRADPGGIAIGDLDGDGVQELLAGASGSSCGAGSCPSGTKTLRGLVAQRLDGSLVPSFPKSLPDFFFEEGDEKGGGIYFWLDDERANTPAITDLDGDGLKEVVWVAPTSLQLFVWDVAGTPAPLIADWPMYHHDAKHSNVLPASR
jgi:hypothetical protein